MADFSNIIQEINTNIPDNNTQSITAAKLRTTLIDLTNAIDTVQDDFQQDISDELFDLVIDNLTSTSTTNALSANQGRILNETIDDVSHSVSDLNNKMFFKTGQRLNDTYIDDTHLVSPKDGALPIAEDVMQLKAELNGMTEDKVTFVEGVSEITGKFINGSTGAISSSSVNSVAIVDVRGFNKVRFSGVILGNPDFHTGYAFCNVTSGDYPNNTLSNVSIQNGYYAEYKHGDSNSVFEYDVVVPSGVSFLLITNMRSLVSNFYAYKQNPQAVRVNNNVLNSNVYKSYTNVIDETTGLYIKNYNGTNSQFYHGIIGLDGVSKFQLYNIIGITKIAFLTEHGNTGIGENSNAIMLPNGKYCYNYTKGYASGVIDVPAGAKYLYFTKYFNNTYASTMDLLLYRDSEIKVSEKHSISIDLCGGALSTSTGKKYAYTANTNQLDLFSKDYSNEKLIAFNPMYDSIDDYNISLVGGTLSIFCFSEKGKVMLGVTTNKDNIPVGTTHIKLNVSYDTAQSVRDITVDLNMTTNNGNTFNTIKSCGDAVYKKFSDFASFFSLEIVRPRIFNDTENTASYYGDSEGRDFATAYIFFSKDYSNTGKPSKVLLNFHGTTSFNIGVTRLTEGQFAVRQFWAKCGYTVIDVTTDTWYTANNYNYGSTTGMASDYPTPLAFVCWSKVLEYCLDVYNLDAENIYAVCKSSGGLNCINFMNKFKNYKVKAAALMAPSIDLFANIRASYNGSINAFLMQIGCVNPRISGITSNGIGVGSVSNANRQYFEANKELIQIYNPMLNGIVTDTFDKDELMNAMLDGLFATRYSGDTSPLDNNETLNQMIDNSKVVNRVPFKIWHAIDDENVPYTTSKWYVKMCQNAGCECHLRQWPANTGRHYFDSFSTVEDDNVGPGGVYTPTLVDYTTKFGEVIQANPAHCEVIDWLNRW